MKRRSFITLLGGAAAAWPLVARAQPRARMRRIGVLLPATSDDAQYQAWFGAFLQALGQSGWTIGRNVQVDTRWATANADSAAGTRLNWPLLRRTSLCHLALQLWGRCSR
jgi:putative ABC transport system substrate-binding protein